MKIQKIVEFVAISKNYIARTMGYLSLFNAFAIILTFKKVYNIPISAYLIVVLGFFAIMVVGYIDYKYVMSYEISHTNKRNNINHKLDKVLAILEDKK